MQRYNHRTQKDLCFMVKKHSKCLVWINTSEASYVQFLKNPCHFAFFPDFFADINVISASFPHFCKGTEKLFLNQNHFNLLSKLIYNYSVP